MRTLGLPLGLSWREAAARLCALVVCICCWALVLARVFVLDILVRDVFAVLCEFAVVLSPGCFSNPSRA